MKGGDKEEKGGREESCAPPETKVWLHHCLFCLLESKFHYFYLPGFKPSSEQVCDKLQTSF